MKKICIALLAALVGGICLSAAPVSSERALEIATRILSGAPTRAAKNNVQIIWNGIWNASSQETPPFYVATRTGGGFVIIAGDDNARPILALSETGQFKVSVSMPENVRWWMDTMKAYVRSQDVPTAEISELWESLVPTRSSVSEVKVTDKVERLTPMWDQGNNDLMYFGTYVFNAACPRTVTGLYTPAGCIPVALGEIMTYQSGIYGDNMPDRGHGTVGGYSVPSGYYRPDAYELGEVYDWEGLRQLKDLNAVYFAGAKIRSNLARLLADLGATVEAGYSPLYGTGASTWDIIGPMAAHFDYSRTAHIETASKYTAHQWVTMLKEEIDKHPVYYDGKRENGAGHAFVFDGYGMLEGTDVFHVNFGWGGMCNGWYYHDNLSATTVNDYSYDCHALFDFFPDAHQVTAHILQLGMTVGKGFTIPEKIPVGEPFELEFSSLRNTGTTAYTGILRACLVKRTGAVIPIGEEYLEGLPTYYGAAPYGLDVCIPVGTELEFGDKIVLYCSTDSEMEEFAPVVYPVDGTSVGELPVMPVPFIARKDTYSQGDLFHFRLMNHTCLYAGTVWTVTAPSGSVTVCKQADGSIQLTESGTYKIQAAVAPKAGEKVTNHIETYLIVE